LTGLQDFYGFVFFYFLLFFVVDILSNLKSQMPFFSAFPAFSAVKYLLTLNF